MATSEQLLHVIARLQGVQSVAQGRRMLLAHLRKVSAAQLAIVFTVDTNHEQLSLLTYSGRRPQKKQPSGELSTHSIALTGLLSSGLYTQGLLVIADLHNDARALREERAWAWPGGRVVLSAIKANERPESSLGLLVLCFDPRIPEPVGIDYEGDLLIGSMLLATYLTGDEEPSRIGTDATDTQGAFPATMGRASPLDEPDLTVEIEEERKRIAFDIHDGAAQRITHALQRLDLLRRVLENRAEASLPLSESTTLLDEINHIYRQLELSLRDLRQSISSLLPAQLEEQSFMTMLNELLDEVRANEPGLELACQIERPDMVPSALEGTIFRFIQEALNNARKHAQATRISLRIRVLSGSLVVEVSDNGRGFQLGGEEEGAGLRNTRSLYGGQEVRRERLGLRAMRERIQALGGNWEVMSRPGEGTTLQARFPLDATRVLLTDREREVLYLVVEGLTNRAIAEHLSVSVETVKSHMHHIMQKMQVKDRTQAAVVAARQHWLYS